MCQCVCVCARARVKALSLSLSLSGLAASHCEVERAVKYDAQSHVPAEPGKGLFGDSYLPTLARARAETERGRGAGR